AGAPCISRRTPYQTPTSVPRLAKPIKAVIAMATVGTVEPEQSQKNVTLRVPTVSIKRLDIRRKALFDLTQRCTTALKERIMVVEPQNTTVLATCRNNLQRASLA